MQTWAPGHQMIQLRSAKFPGIFGAHWSLNLALDISGSRPTGKSAIQQVWKPVWKSALQAAGSWALWLRIAE